MPVVVVVVALITVAVIANLVLMGILIAPAFATRPARPAMVALPTPRPLASVPAEAPRPAVLSAGGGARPDDADRGSDGARGDRIVRIVAWVFLLVTAVLVLVGHQWPANETAILILLAVAGAFVVVLHDLLPSDALGSSRFSVEATVALTGAAALLALTGGTASPFVFVIPLIVAGSALVVSARMTVLLTVAGIVAYLAGIALGSPVGSFDAGTAVIVVAHLTSLVLLTFVAMVIARVQREARDAAIRLSTIDPLTGLFNRRHFFAEVENEIARSARSRRGFCLLMMDLDGLRGVNDRLGHVFGDRVLSSIGAVIADDVRRIDTAARYGGDEFVVLLPETDAAGAWFVAEKVRQGVRSMPLELPADMPRPTVSIGVVSYPEDGRSVEELFINADALLYASKRAGKDRVTMQRPLMERTA